MSVTIRGGASGNLADVVAKGLQGAFALQTVELKDSGRNAITLFVDRAAGAASETLATMSIVNAGATTSATQYTVTTGKIFRIKTMMMAVRASTTTIVSGRVRVRAQGTVSITSPIYAAMEAGSNAAVAENTGVCNLVIPEGLEIAAGLQVGVTHIESSATGTISILILGYEY